MTFLPCFRLLPLLLTGSVLVAQGTQEYVAKVRLLEKITAYVEWPSAPAEAPFVLAVVGRTPFGDELDNYFQGKSVKGRPVQIRYFRGPEDIGDCDLLFVCASEKDRLPQILGKVRGRPVLTLGDTPGFASSGVMINLVREENRLAFEVNITRTREAGLRMAAGFLKLSRPVE
jgi:hypothetical protein